MIRSTALLAATFLAVPATSLLAQATARSGLSAADQAAAFRAAGFTRKGTQWQACGDPGSASYQPGAIETVRDINGDGLPDAIITEGSTACFGQDETGYSLVSKQANGAWKLITSGSGVPKILPRAAASGWPDIEVGGPGFCFPVERWNGRAYALQRHQYEGRPCRPGR